MWSWTRIALGAGLAGALLLAAPTEAPAGGTIGAATGEFEVRARSTQVAEVASGEAPFEVGEHGSVALTGADETPVGTTAATAEGKTAASPPSRTSVKADPAARNSGTPGKEKSADACGAVPSSTPIGGWQKK